MFHVKHQKHFAGQAIWADEVKTTKSSKPGFLELLCQKSGSISPNSAQSSHFRRKHPKFAKKTSLSQIFCDTAVFFGRFGFFSPCLLFLSRITPFESDFRSGRILFCRSEAIWGQFDIGEAHFAPNVPHEVGADLQTNSMFHVKHQAFPMNIGTWGTRST
jgi:hypothetical protein